MQFESYFWPLGLHLCTSNILLLGGYYIDDDDASFGIEVSVSLLQK
jgi:hypothetical protein